MEVYIEAVAEHIPDKKRFVSNSAFFTFVAIDEGGNTVAVPEAVPQTDKEKELFEGALRRRQLRLIFAGEAETEGCNRTKSNI
jgi:acyl-CoA hydrolase